MRSAAKTALWIRATARIAHLLAKIGAGTARPGLIDRHPAPRPKRVTSFRISRASAMLGLPVGPDRARQILAGLGFGVNDQSEPWQVEVPTWRSDVSREADLVEEVGRHLGVDRIPSTVPPARGHRRDPLPSTTPNSTTFPSDPL